MSGQPRLTAAAAGAVAVGCAAVLPVYADGHWLGAALGAIATVAVTGWAARSLRLPAVLQPALTALTLGLYVSAVFAADTLRYLLLPTDATRLALDALVHAGLSDMQRLAAPVPTHAGLTLIATAGVGAVAVLVDLVAVTLRRAAPAGLPLLVLYAVPSAVVPGGLGWLAFVLCAAGWLGLLRAEGRDRTGRWGSPATGQDGEPADRVGRRIGAAALGVAVVLPALVPGMGARLIGGGHGTGPGGSGTTTTTYNPITRLRADLRLPRPREVLRYTTDASRPDYLRMTTLDQFTDAGWSSSRLIGDPAHNGVRHPLPAPVGVQPDQAATVHVTVRIHGLDAQWLPAPAVPTRVSVSGPWLYDPRSETLFAIHTGTRRLSKAYDVTSLQPHVDPAGLAVTSASELPPDIQPYAADPGGQVTDGVRRLTAGIVRGAGTPYTRAVALLRFFTDPAQHFRYSISSRVPGIDRPSALEAFLIGRQGFCEQYASAMAAMARVAGLPARVAVGFTPGVRQSDGSYLVTTSDAHAWPEVWFDGAGWVRFEPTPRGDQVSPGPYDSTAGAQPSATASAVPSPGEPSSGPSASGSAGPSRGRLEQPQAGSGAARSGGSSGVPVWPVLLALLTLAALALLPPFGHLLRRHWLSRRPDPLAAWQLLREDAADLGHRWLPTQSPRAATARLAEAYALRPAGLEALERVTLAVELARYAPAGRSPEAALLADVATVRAALRGAVRRRTRLRAWLLPESTLRGASAAVGTRIADLLDRVDAGWASLRRRVRLPA